VTDRRPGGAASGPAAARVTPPRRGGHVRPFVRELLLVVVGALVLSTLLRAFVGQMFVIPSGSMEGTLLERDRIVVEKVSTFHRGDVVVFQDPGNWLPDEPEEDPGVLDRALELVGVPAAGTRGHLVKRVVGLPGDRVVCCDADGRLTVNGYPLDEHDYLYTGPDGQVAPSEVRFRVVVPQGRIFVMGDHRDDSADSRCHLADRSTDQARGAVAFVPEDLVVGPVVAIAGPLDRLRRLTRPTTFAGVPAATDPAPEQAGIAPAGVTCS